VTLTPIHSPSVPNRRDKLIRLVRERLVASTLVAPPGPDAGAQMSLRLAYAAAQPLPFGRELSSYGFSCYSQSDEDGILLYIMSVIGTTDRRCVEICAGDGIECNTANLIINHGWHGLLVDGDATRIARGVSFYRRSRATCIHPPTFKSAWVTRGGVNGLLADNGFSGTVDLLSLDLDGVDYWIWEALTEITPRVVVLEYQDILGPDRSWSVPYADDFDASRYSMTGAMPNFAGASLRAFVNLGRRKGYRLVGVNRYGYNAFFVRDDVGIGVLNEVAVEDCFGHEKVRAGMRDRFPLVANLPWIEVPAAHSASPRGAALESSGSRPG
jgi:hypothetical protein